MHRGRYRDVYLDFCSHTVLPLGEVVVRMLPDEPRAARFLPLSHFQYSTLTAYLLFTSFYVAPAVKNT